MSYIGNESQQNCRKKKKNNATNQIVTDYSHDERLYDSTIIGTSLSHSKDELYNASEAANGNESDHERIVMTAKMNTKTMREYGKARRLNDASQRCKRGYTTRTMKPGLQCYGTLSELACCYVVKKITRFTLYGGINLER